jgi:Flp pilus assembly protein CpaB
MQDAKRRAILFLTVAMLLSVVAGYLFMQKVSTVDATLGEFTSVYVAAKNISSREPLKPEFFKPVKVPVRFLPQSAVTSLDGIQVEENTYPIQHLITVVPLKEGDLLTTNILKTQGKLSSDKHRMVVLHRSDKVVFDGVFDTNDLVDIIVSDRGRNNDIYTDIFMEKVKVVGVGRDSEGNITSIGLEMTLEEAKKFIHKQNFAVAIRVLKAPNLEGSSQNRVIPQAVPKNPNRPNGGQAGNGSGEPMHEENGDENH